MRSWSPVPRDAVRSRRARASDLDAAARRKRTAVLQHAHLIDRLAGAEGDVAVRAAERAAERVGQLLRHEQAAVRLHDDLDVRLREVEGLRVDAPGEGERGDRRREERRATTQAGHPVRRHLAPPALRAPRAGSRTVYPCGTGREVHGRRLALRLVGLEELTLREPERSREDDAGEGLIALLYVRTESL
jgi:hypothetical protein